MSESYFLYMGNQQNRLEPAPTVSVVENSDEDEDYDSDRSHPRKQRPKGKKKVATSLVKKKRAPLVALSDTSVKKKPRKEVPPAFFPPSPPTFLPPIPKTEPQTSCPPENTLVETVQILSSPEAPEAPQEEVSSPVVVAQKDSSVAVPEGTEVVEELAGLAPVLIQPEALRVQEVVPSPPVVQEAAEEEVVETPAPTEEVVGVEAPVQEEAILVLEVQEEASVVQEEVPTTVEEDVVPAVEDVLVVVPAVEDVLEVVEAPVPAIREEARAEVVQEETPAVEEIPVVQEPSTLIPLETPSQQLLSHVEGLMLQVWKDRMASRMLSPNAVRDTSLVADANFIIGRLQEVSHDVTPLQIYTQKLQALREMESLAGEKASRTSKDSAEIDAREALDVLTSKLDNAEIALDEAAEDLSRAEADHEDAGEYLELAKEQFESNKMKVVYFATQVKQIRESVQEAKEAVLEAERKMEEVIAMPTLSASEEAILQSLKAAFVESQQQIAKDL
ncbi:hypothetical protein H6P81_018172 [Aristolochia fimbriata]|uniref:Uncharacterized protein n=1 Tax=Aristolochia fimbriata TaxID=158543 RepID=A0AAV7E121_ARIFI|nr:hypothetical protein H6P81_018172 [Aristolochia fimbriata]